MPERPRVPARLRAPVFGLAALVAVAALAASAPPPARATDGPTVGKAEPPARGGEVAQPEQPRPTGRLLVRYRPGTAPEQRRADIRTLGMSTARDLPTLPDIEVVVPGSTGANAALAALTRRPNVVSVDIEYYRGHLADPADEPGLPEQWSLHNTGQVVNGWEGTPDVDMNLPEAWPRTQGSDQIVVAVIDDGVDFSHPDLVGAAWTNPGETGQDSLGRDKANNGEDDDGNLLVDDVNGWDFCNGDKTVHDPGEDYHGTSMAGLIAGRANGHGIAGVAPNVKIMAVKFMDNGTSCGTDAQAIAAIQYAAAKGATFSTNSWGGTGYSAALEAAVEGSGRLFVAAAGNDGIDNDTDPLRTYPASFDSPNIMSVAAVHNQGWLSNFSNYGASSVDIAAPGEDIVSPVPAGTPDCQQPDQVHTMGFWSLCSGTSHAAALASGVAALAASAKPQLAGDPLALRQHIIDTGKPLPLTFGWTASGRMVDAHAAVVDRPIVQRLSGPNRFATAAAISQRTFQPGPYYAFVATGANFPDALAGGAVAAQYGWPLLLVNQNSIPAATAAELTRLSPMEIIVLGSAGVISEPVRTQLANYSQLGSAIRVAGADRYATAAAVASMYQGFPGGVPTAYIAVGTNFPDALAGAPASALSPGPMLLVKTNEIPPATRQALQNLAPQRIVILGSAGVVSTTVAAQLDQYTNGPVLRWWGPDRYQTGVAISANSFTPNAETIFIATGTNFPDALAGGPAGGAFLGPLLLVPGNTVPAAVEAEILRIRPSRIFILGGDTVVTNQVVNEINALFP